MIRIFIENLLMFLAPTLIYAGYVLVRSRIDGNDKPVWSDAPLLWLCGAGIVLMVSTLLFFGSTSGWAPGAAYQPPVYKDGKIVPGQVVK